MSTSLPPILKNQMVRKFFSILLLFSLALSMFGSNPDKIAHAQQITTLSSIQPIASTINPSVCITTDGSNGRLSVDNSNSNGAAQGCLVTYLSYPIVRVRVYNEHSFWTKIDLRDNLNKAVITPENIWATSGYIAPKAYAEYTLTFTPKYQYHVMFLVNGARSDNDRMSAAVLTIISRVLNVLGIDLISANFGDFQDVVKLISRSQHALPAADALISLDLARFTKEFHSFLGDDQELAIIGAIAARFGKTVSTAALKNIFTAVKIALTLKDVWDNFFAVANISYVGTVSFTSQTSIAPTILFSAEKTTLNAGECTSLQWNVENVREVHLDGEGVAGHDSRKVCPNSTKVYKLSILRRDGRQEERTITIHVTQVASGCTPSGNTYTCTILATVGWQQTPLTIKPDTPYSIWYKGGTWTINASKLPYVDADGYPKAIDSQLPGGCSLFPAFVPYAKLVIKIGEQVIVPDRAEASTLLIGSNGRNQDTGVLSLRINEKDECLADNDGSIVVEISQSPPTLPTQPSPTGAVCGQYIRINQSPDKLPAFQPYGTNEVWIFDPIIFERYLADKFQEGSYVKIDNPSFGDDKSPAWGYARVRYMEDSDDETIVPNCGNTPVVSTPIPPEQQIDLAQLREKILSHARNAAVSTSYHQEAQQLVDALLVHLDDFQLASIGVTKDTMVQALNKGDVGTRVNAAVQAIWGLWVDRAKQGGFNVSDTDPGSFAEVSPFRQLVIRLVQGHQGNLRAAEQQALYSYFTRKEESHTWKDNMNGVIGAINRESFRAEQPTPMLPSASTPVALATPLPTGAPFQILSPRDGAILKCKPTFAWQDGIGLPPGHVYEIIVWKPGQDWAKDGRGITKADLRTSRDVDLNYLDDKQDWFAPGEYEWGILDITPDPYTRHRMLGAGGRFTFVRDGTCQ